VFEDQHRRGPGRSRIKRKVPAVFPRLKGGQVLDIGPFSTNSR